MTKKHDDTPENKITPGYGSSGASLWERHAARGHAVDTRPTRERITWSRLDIMVQHERKVIERLERRAKEARGTPAHGPICVRLQRLRHFLVRLVAEQRELAS